MMSGTEERFALTGKFILYFLPALALIGVIAPLVLGKTTLVLLGSYIVVPMFLAPIVYLKYRKNSYESASLDERLFLLLLVFYTVCYSVSVIILFMFEARPVVYYVIVALMAAFIMFEILLSDISRKKLLVILLQIMALVLNIVWSVTQKYYFFIERTDPLAHAWYINSLLTQGHVTSVFNLYQNYPLWHIMVSSVYMILNIPIPVYKIMFFIQGLNFAFMMPMIYLIVLKIFKDKRMALMSALFAAVNPDIDFFGMSSIPRSVVSSLEVMLILLLLDYNESRKVFLAISITLIIVIYHTASMLPFIALILFIIYILQKLYHVEREPRFLTWNYLLLACIATVAYWMYRATNVFDVIISDASETAVEGTITKSIVYTPLSELFNYLQYVPLLFFVIIGALWVLESKRFSGFEKIFSLTGLLLVAVTFPGPGLLVNRLAGNFNLERFGEYSLMLIVIVGGVGFIGIYYKARRKLRAAVVILFIIMSFLSVSNDFVASDNPLIKRTFYTFYLTEEEVTAFNHVADKSEGYVLSDYVTRRYLEYSPYESKSHILEVNPVNMQFVRGNNSNVMLIRDQELKKRPLRFYITATGKFVLNPTEKGGLDYYFDDSLIWNDLGKYNKVYNSGSVYGYN